jgi:predicted aspartyl protease
MIEVEGMINNHSFTILIDSGASHIYIDPKVMDRLFFQEESMRNVGWYI